MQVVGDKLESFAPYTTLSWSLVDNNLTNLGIISPALWSVTVSPIRISLVQIISIVALETVVLRAGLM